MRDRFMLKQRQGRAQVLVGAMSLWLLAALPSAAACASR